jgi:hypothetical protein
MTEEQVLIQIEELKSQLTGDLFKDGETQQAIYELKLQLKPEIEEEPAVDDFDDEGCLYCGS